MGGTWDRNDTALSEEKSQHWIDETTTSYKLHLKTGNNCEEMLRFLSLGNCRSVIFTSYSNIIYYYHHPNILLSKYPTIIQPYLVRITQRSCESVTVHVTVYFMLYICIFTLYSYMYIYIYPGFRLTHWSLITIWKYKTKRRWTPTKKNIRPEVWPRWQYQNTARLAWQ